MIGDSRLFKLFTEECKALEIGWWLVCYSFDCLCVHQA